LTDLAPQSAFSIISTRTTLKVAQRILKDAAMIAPHAPRQKVAKAEFELGAYGYYDIDAEQLILGLINKNKKKLYWRYNSHGNKVKHCGSLKQGMEETPPMAT